MLYFIYFLIGSLIYCKILFDFYLDCILFQYIVNSIVSFSFIFHNWLCIFWNMLWYFKQLFLFWGKIQQSDLTILVKICRWHQQKCKTNKENSFSNYSRKLYIHFYLFYLFLMSLLQYLCIRKLSLNAQNTWYFLLNNNKLRAVADTNIVESETALNCFFDIIPLVLILFGSSFFSSILI